ncbi:hypothetical protein [Marimonas arenosa]|uniref:Uncharacterized protein n=1 Tax=Marimonas arenosa TaxID=1795305 RepID=A0AAE4B6T1_9RHOB|nr:hypothetical protein [Marimonas arenosa]MDQ2092392.1 hypothetical protein [Marimonas arenosa]
MDSAGLIGFGTSPANKTKLFEIRPACDAVLAGSLTTGGTGCGGGCDRVFSDDYDLPSIAEHTEAMLRLGHLPNVGPAPEHTPVDVTDKLGRMLNELEHAHLYIAELNAENRRFRTELSQLRADADARFARLESVPSARDH